MKSIPPALIISKGLFHYQSEKMSQVGITRGERTKEAEALLLQLLKTEKTQQNKTNTTKLWFFEKVNSSDISLPRTKKKKKKTQIVSVIKRGNFITDIKRMISY